MGKRRDTTQGRIEIEYYETEVEANVRAEEIIQTEGPEGSVLVYKARNYDWMGTAEELYAVRWIKPIAGLVPHG